MSAHHYDLSDQLYDLFLDRTGNIPAPISPRRTRRLDTAQANKKRHIAAKLLLRAGPERARYRLRLGRARALSRQRMRRRVTGLTLSIEQLEVARRAAPPRPGSPTASAFELRDYREDDGQLRPHRLGRHVRACRRRPLPDLLPQGEGAADARRRGAAALDRPHATGRARPIPGCANTSSPAAIRRRCRRSCRWSSGLRLWITDIEILRLHYAETLQAGARASSPTRDRVRALYDERFCRMWEFYLAGSEIAFRHRGPPRLSDADWPSGRRRAADPRLHVRLGAQPRARAAADGPPRRSSRTPQSRRVTSPRSTACGSNWPCIRRRARW